MVPHPSVARPPVRPEAAEFGPCSSLQEQRYESSASTRGLRKTAPFSIGDLSRRRVPLGLTQARRLSSSRDVQCLASSLIRTTGEDSKETVRTRDPRSEKAVCRPSGGVEGSGLVLESLSLRSRPRPTLVADLTLLQLLFLVCVLVGGVRKVELEPASGEDCAVTEFGVAGRSRDALLTDALFAVVAARSRSLL